jgi:F-type H+-transporting ATPase subunit delta
MAEHGSIARPYAQAVFELAHAAGELPAWSEFLKLAAVLVSEPEVNRMLFTPGADLTRLATTIAELCREQLGNPAPLRDGERSTGANFLQVLVSNQRLGVLPDIAARFEVLKTDAENMLDVTLSSASPVSDDQKASIADSLKKRFGRQVRLTVQIDSNLIGGARLQVGDHVIDGSVRTGLDKLATALRG